MDMRTHTHTRCAMPVTKGRFAKMHETFEAAASQLGVLHRSIESNARGIQQHVVLTKSGGLLRWPVWYSSNASVGL